MNCPYCGNPLENDNLNFRYACEREILPSAESLDLEEKSDSSKKKEKI